MELFNEYYSSEIQFLFDLYSLNRPFTKEEAIKIAKESNVYTDVDDFRNVLQKWLDNNLFEECGRDKYKAVLPSFIAPLNTVEREYLSDICTTNEAALFGIGDLRDKLQLPNKTPFDFINRQNSTGKKLSPSSNDPEIFQILLKAICEKKLIIYDYRTNSDATVRTATAVPYKFEYSVFDGRWWLISYNIEENRVIKSRLQNLIDVKIGEKHDISEDRIKVDILKHLCHDPIVLRIRNQKNAIERCFMAFENMLEMTASDLGNDEYELKFRFFDWDRHIIVRKLMYLGEMVTVISPQSIVGELVGELRKALASNCN